MKKQIIILLVITTVLILCTGALAADPATTDGAAATATPSASNSLFPIPSVSMPVISSVPSIDPSAIPSSLPTTIPSSLPTTIPSLSPNVTNTCTCCGATYTGTVCPNCMKTRCSVCNKCPLHCTCRNTTLTTGDHYAYISGYANGTFRPTGSITRAEAAAIFYRILQNKNYTAGNTFSDVKQGSWYYTAVTCLASKGVVSGYGDGTFRPNGLVTRAEICVMASRFYSMIDCQIHYTDVPADYWAYKYIASAVGHGCINDYVGEFKPTQPMTRLETVLFVNNATERQPDKTYIDANIKKLVTFSDVTSENIAYYSIIEASNSHTCSNTSGTETWTAMKK